MSDKLRVATASLAGCFGCHMSLLDIDERLLELILLVEFERSPINDIKQIEPVDVAIIEGGVANTDNVEVLREFRRQSNILVAIGACAINGGIPSMRNHFSVKECLEESYINGIGVLNPMIPNDPEIPLLLNKVHPIHEVVKVDYVLPGCPPSGDAIWTFLTELLEGRPIHFPYNEIHYD
ncbi:NAD-reducing [NiFe] hydrogenase HoxFUYH(E), subunit delta (HoxY) [hydrothermal vent metagenome]|uniref:NAD-reducing [NiFe] hydrogenase HoxFUYH(E), subunit delta (HoxY) n=1 Tax=hydrothermal vent metagenome TaxID=652676 RepID=A0A3B1BF48_9ZZZZ|nr:NADP oxidoreductase [Gammaproteobacteria bacterium]